MYYINLHIPTVLKSIEYIAADTRERGTWLSVLSYACELECTGVLVGAALWKDRQWQQACGVTRREVHGAPRLLRVVGEDVHVHGYPVDSEKQVQANRKSAKA